MNTWDIARIHDLCDIQQISNAVELFLAAKRYEGSVQNPFQICDEITSRTLSRGFTCIQYTKYGVIISSSTPKNNYPGEMAPHSLDKYWADFRFSLAVKKTGYK